MSAWKKICCALDFSEESRFAMQEAVDLASRSGGELTLLHVVSDPRRRTTESQYLSEVSAASRGDPGRQLEEWRNAAERIAQHRVLGTLLTGMPVDEIVRFAREGGYDLVVIGTPGALGCERIVFGSVAEGVIRRAPCTVVVARRRIANPRS